MSVDDFERDTISATVAWLLPGAIRSVYQRRCGETHRPWGNKRIRRYYLAESRDFARGYDHAVGPGGWMESESRWAEVTRVIDEAIRSPDANPAKVGAKSADSCRGQVAELVEEYGATLSGRELERVLMDCGLIKLDQVVAMMMFTPGIMFRVGFMARYRSIIDEALGFVVARTA